MLGLLGWRAIVTCGFQLVEPFFDGRHLFGQGQQVLQRVADSLFRRQLILLPEPQQGRD